MNSQIKAFLCAGLSILAWSTVATAFKIALETLSPMQLIYLSMGTAALFLLLATAISGHLHEVRQMTGSQWRYSALLGLMLYLYYTLLFIGYAKLPAQIAQPVNNTWALMLTLLAVFFLKQPFSLKEFGWMLFAYSGVLIISFGAGASFGPLSSLGMSCIIASTLLYALYWIMNTRSDVPPLSGCLICFAVAAVLAALTLWIRDEAMTFSVRPLLSGVYVGLFELAIPFLLWSMALRCTSSVSRISTLPFLIPFLSLFWIALILGETVAWSTVLGLAVIVSGTIMQQRTATKRKNIQQ